MQTKNHKAMIDLATKHQGVLIATAVLRSVENDMVSPSMLQVELQKIDSVSGHFNKISDQSVEFELTTVQPPREELGETEERTERIAWSQSQSNNEALLHAILGFLRELDQEAAKEADNKNLRS